VVDPLSGSNGVIVIPVLWIMVYGIASLLSTVFGNLRDAIFVNVQIKYTRTWSKKKEEEEEEQN
jgi:hypothetical protein